MNPNLSKSMAYLAKYTNETEDLQSQGNKKAVQYTEKNGKRNDICYEFERNGACLRKGCKFIHMNRNKTYPSYSGTPKDRNSQNRPKNSRSNTKQSQKGNPVPRYVDHQQQNSEQNSEAFTFLGEIKDILKTLKDFTQQHVAQMAPYPNQHFIPVASQGHHLWGVEQYNQA